MRRGAAWRVRVEITFVPPVWPAFSPQTHLYPDRHDPEPCEYLQEGRLLHLRHWLLKAPNGLLSSHLHPRVPDYSPFILVRYG